MSRIGKYLWSDDEWKKYCEKEAKEMRDNGFPMNTRSVTRQIYDKVIVPNNIKIKDLIKDKIKINKRRWKRRLI